jgi:hypothetical protein
MSRKNKIRNKFKIFKSKAPVVEMIIVPGLTPIPKIELAITPDYNKLQMLLDMRTYSKGSLQDVLVSKLDDYFKNLGAVTEKDAYGSLYVTKGNAEFYPCVVGHTDINQETRDRVKVITEYPWIFGFDLDKAEQSGIGADDKVGVYFAVHMFDLFDNIKLFFPKDEEVGLVGTYKANKDFFADCSMLVQLDRNSYKNDLITYTNGITVCSDEFVDAASSTMTKYGYAKNNGSCTDIGGLKKYDTVNCVAMNVSCGYINEHSDEEVISMPHFENAINFGYELLKMGVDKVWEHKSEVPDYSTYGTYVGYGAYGTTYSGRSSWLDDDLGVTENNLTTFTALTPTNGKITLDIKDKFQSSFMEDSYMDLWTPESREIGLEHSTLLELEEHDYDMLKDQSYIDECLTDKMCPCCYNYVEVTNSMLLYVDCDYCGSTWNRPKDIILNPNELKRREW